MSKVKLNPAPYQGHLGVSYIRFNPLDPIDASMAAKKTRFSFREKLGRELTLIYDERIPQLVSKGVDPSRIWVAIDTETHLQGKLLEEGQGVLIGGPTGKKVVDGEIKSDREFTAQIDWVVNAAIMSRIQDYLLDQPYNLILSMLEKADKTYENTYRAMPAIQGASLQRVMGDLDVILHLTSAEGGEHTLHGRCSSTREAKDCFDALPPTIPLLRAQDTGQATLAQIRNLIFSSAQPTQPPAQPAP